MADAVASSTRDANPALRHHRDNGDEDHMTTEINLTTLNPKPYYRLVDTLPQQSRTNPGLHGCAMESFFKRLSS